MVIAVCWDYSDFYFLLYVSVFFIFLQIKCQSQAKRSRKISQLLMFVIIFIIKILLVTVY